MTLLEMQQDFRSWLTAESQGAAERLGGLAAPGLAVYINNYRGQLLACLAHSYPVLQAWLGEERFERAAAMHIDGLPPHDWTLDAYALDFPASLRTLFPNDLEVAELALLELDLGLAFVGADSPLLEIRALGDLDWDQAALELVPTFSIRSFATNAAAIWAAISAGEMPPPAALLEGPSDVAIWRFEFTPTFRTLGSLESVALEMALCGHGFGEICSRLVQIEGMTEGVRTAGEFLAEWLRAGLIRSVRISSP